MASSEWGGSSLRNSGSRSLRGSGSFDKFPPIQMSQSTTDLAKQRRKEKKARDRYSKNWEGIRREMREEERAKVRVNAIIGHGDAVPSLRPSRDPKDKEIFSHFVLNKDPEASKYMPYDSVAYPKMTRARPGPTAAAERDSLWLQGFLDHVKENASSLMSEGVAPFMQLPGEGILPQAQAELNRLSKQRLIEIERDATYTPRFQDGVAEGGKKRDQSAENIKQSLTTEESLALTKLDKSLHPEPYRTAYEKNMVIYQRENRKLRRVLHGTKKVAKVRPSVQSTDMGNLFELNRREVQATIVLQRGWKRTLLRRFWKLRIYQMLRVKMIQAVARGYIARRLVADWYRERLRLAIQWQARVRGYLRIKRAKLRFAEERDACPPIQRVIRGFLGRRRFVFLRRSLAALALQRLWRGCVGRTESDRRWLHPRAMVIQKMVRGMLGRMAMDTGKAEKAEMAAKIQRSWRGFFARRARNVKLFDRETKYREAVVASLSAEMAYCLEQYETKKRQYKRKKLDEKEEALEDVLSTSHEKIRGLEISHTELNRQRRLVSPRAIQQGWREELVKNIAEHREQITAAKLEALFTTSLKLGRIRDEKTKRAEEIDELRFKCDKYNEWREEEIQDGLDRENRHHHDNDSKKKQQRIAHERRRWQVRWVRPSGKPDKNRRPGRPWDPAAYAGPERETFCGGNSDVFAFNASVDSLRMGSDESLKRVMGQVQLQNYLNEVQSMDTLLKPLAKPLAEIQHQKPLWKEEEEFRSNENPEHYWLPTKADSGVPYDAKTKPPADPVRPPKFPSYPSPRDLHQMDVDSHQAVLDSIEEAKRLRAEHLASKRVRNDRPDKNSDPNYDSRMGAYGERPEGEGLGGEDDPEARFDDSSTLDLDSFAKQRKAREQRLETDKRREAQAGKRRDRRAKKHKEPVSRIPWALLDELAHEKHKLKAEQAVTLMFDDKNKKDEIARLKAKKDAPHGNTKEGDVQRYADNGF